MCPIFRCIHICIRVKSARAACLRVSRAGRSSLVQPRSEKGGFGALPHQATPQQRMELTRGLETNRAFEHHSLLKAALSGGDMLATTRRKHPANATVIVSFRTSHRGCLCLPELSAHLREEHLNIRVVLHLASLPCRRASLRSAPLAFPLPSLNILGLRRLGSLVLLPVGGAVQARSQTLRNKSRDVGSADSAAQASVVFWRFLSFS